MVTLTKIERDILHACRSRGNVSAYRKETVDGLIRRCLLDWNDPPFVEKRTASTTRAGLEALGSIE